MRVVALIVLGVGDGGQSVLDGGLSVRLLLGRDDATVVVTAEHRDDVVVGTLAPGGPPPTPWLS